MNTFFLIWYSKPANLIHGHSEALKISAGSHSSGVFSWWAQSNLAQIYIQQYAIKQLVEFVELLSLNDWIVFMAAFKTYALGFTNFHANISPVSPGVLVLNIPWGKRQDARPAEQSLGFPRVSRTSSLHPIIIPSGERVHCFLMCSLPSFNQVFQLFNWNAFLNVQTYMCRHKPKFLKSAKDHFRRKNEVYKKINNMLDLLKIVQLQFNVVWLLLQINWLPPNYFYWIHYWQQN